jgi:23S rRNA (uracil1939-C5)-methyltransferase
VSHVVARPPRGAELDLRIDSLAFGGNGVARSDGYVVFVQGAIPGDRVRAVLTKGKRAYGEARTLEVLEPSPDRIAPVADHPGAPWQVLPYERQLQVKAEQVDEALRRIGKLDGYELEPIVPAVEQWRYRNKLEFSFGTGPGKELVCGFHAPGSWETILHVEDCMLQSERGNELRRAVLAWCREQDLDAYNRRLQEGFLRNLVIREGRRTGEFQVRLVTSEGEIDTDSLREAIQVHSLLWTQVPGVAEVSIGPTEIVDGSPTFDEELGDLRFRVSPDAFFQTNTEMAEQLYGIAAEFAALQGWERVYDLFCGIGTIGLSLAPNAAQLAEAGYTLKRVRPVDMFPQTPHIECVALIEKGMARD